jgi:hypothetical protein
MAYYPKSQIKTKLYTNGGEYTLSPPLNNNAIPYVGYYYQTSNGTRFTGKTPQDGPSQILYPINNEVISSDVNFTPPIIYNEFLSFDNTNNQYSRIKNTTPISRAIPQFNPNPPTQQEKTNGQYTRYFCKRNNELKYIEINLDTYTQLSTQDPHIAWDLYTPASVLWQIQGDKNTVYVSNQASVYSIEKKLQWYGFSQYFQGQFLKYYLGS